MPPYFILITPLQEDIHFPSINDIIEVVTAIENAEASVIEDCSDFLILERAEEKSKEGVAGYMQARPYRGYGDVGMFLVEYRDSREKRHYASHVEAGAPVVAMFESYLNEDGAWREMAVWRDISFRFEDLHPSLSPEELAASLFPDGEWEDSLKAKKLRDEEFWKRIDETS